MTEMQILTAWHIKCQHCDMRRVPMLSIVEKIFAGIDRVNSKWKVMKIFVLKHNFN